MNLSKGFYAALGISILIIAVYLFFTPQGAYHTYYDRIFYDTLSIQSYDEKTVNVLIENQTNYEFRLSASNSTDVNVKVVIADSDGNKISINNPKDFGSRIEGSFKSTVPGNYSFHLTEQNGNSYSAEFLVRERIDDYYPGGGRYASINNFMRRIQAFFLAIIGTGLILSVFWKNIKKQLAKCNLKTNTKHRLSRFDVLYVYEPTEDTFQNRCKFQLWHY